MHYIQYSILDLLMRYENRRFSELRPKNVDSNLFQYHLGKLLKDGYVAKTGRGYRLSTRGLYYADRHSSELKAERPQPKIITIVIIKNRNGEALLLQKPRQPFIGSYHLPAGKVHEGEAAEAAARRELFEKTGLELPKLLLTTTVHVTIRHTNLVVSEFYGVVARGRYDGEAPTGIWYSPGQPTSLCPSVAEILETPDQPQAGICEWKINLPAEALVIS